MEVLLVDLVAFFKVGNKRDVPVFLETAWSDKRVPQIFYFYHGTYLKVE